MIGAPVAKVPRLGTTMKELTSEWQFEEIVADPNSPQDDDPDAQEEFYALEIGNRFGSQAMKLLVAQFQPLVDMGFGHLKRMKKHPSQANKLIALVCPTRLVPSQQQDKHQQVPPQLLPLAAQFDNATICQVSVLKHAPKTKEAFMLHTKQWPLIFHDTEVPEAPEDKVNYETMQKHLQRVLLRCRQLDNQPANARHHIHSVCCSRVCSIVDPNETFDAAEVAHNDTSLPTGDRRSEDSSQSTCHPGVVLCEPLVHAVMRAIDGVAQRDRQRETAKRARMEQPEAPSHKPKAAVKGSTAFGGREESYLCTGYDVYLDQEPCSMCAMALVHSRARRVVFAHPNPQFGALVSCHRLHTIKSLNHHFRVFCLHHHCKEPTPTHAATAAAATVPAALAAAR